ncbi:DNA/RNA non-specific endonuclease [Agromyces kandeliae]|uniref:DNA/RNA non-specific endonuclease n=1 Tax=Agromyces kandeliae TaxID=2666141 RepID=A0A6L5R1I8_9MICO|nr:DNA/RNA non-specific endonuclease [Agromyces kandeliae]MRX43850.1 DNA/RNA non-specific endonuclease [Agromyces kandeliae]
MGFDARFLGVEAPMPSVPEADAAASVALDHLHFTIVLDTRRRFARMTGVNVDGAALVEVERRDDWEYDARIPEDWQAGPEVYARNDLDRGHLVRRRDPVWGPPEVAARANAETFRYPNAAPQQAEFNQSLELWNGLEDHVLAFARVHAQRLSVFTAPVLAVDDPPYRGIQVPLRFVKVVAWRSGDELATAGFLLDQAPVVDLDDPMRSRAGIAARERARVAAGAAEVPDLGPFRTFQVAVADIAAITGVEMPLLVAADRMTPALAADGPRELTQPEDLRLGAP